MLYVMHIAHHYCASQTDIAYTQFSLKSINLNELLYLLFASSGSDLVADFN